ncbi:MAG: DivIVA domain-containing protein [Oscillibacter sp.]|nr:DivIVA domain-containing protein [Oscillibacter sp.]
MLTPKEVSEHSFTKAALGGYNMKQVDDFLDELTDDYSALFKENAALKAKMKVLVEKVDDYRATEDSMRATLLTAQKMADSIIHEAEEKRDQILTQTEIDAKLKMTRLKAETEESAARLRKGQEDLRSFIAAVREACEKEIAILATLPELPVEVAAEEPAAENPVDAIEEKVLAAFGEESAEEAPAEAPAEKPAADALPDGELEKNPFGEPEDLEATRQINLQDLRFGRNLNLED